MPIWKRTLCLAATLWFCVAVVGGAEPADVAGGTETRDLTAAIRAVRGVGREGAGHVEAITAWRELGSADAGNLPQILAGMDGAGPLATNWFRAAVDSIAERSMAEGGKLPVDPLEKFVRDGSHSPRPRRLAYEWIVAVDPTTPGRLLPDMLDDPSPELRRDAVALVMSTAERATGREARALYRKALNAARALDQVKGCTEALDKLGESIDLAVHLGYVLDWYLTGPFDNTSGRGFDIAYPPEKEIRFDASYEGKLGPVRWLRHHTHSDSGVVDLNKVFDKYKGAIVYAAAELFAEMDQQVQLRLGSINACKVWLNGQLAAAHETYHTAMAADQYISTVQLPRGKNLILLKICQDEQQLAWTERWEFQLRVTDASGAAVHSCQPVD